MSVLKVQLPSDFIGAAASALCLVHCLATPFLFVAQAYAAKSCCTSDSPGWWSAIDYLFIGITFLAVYFSAKNTSKEWMKYALYGCWVLLGLLIVNQKMTLIPISEMLKNGAALGLISLHLYNLKFCRCSDEECCAA